MIENKFPGKDISEDDLKKNFHYVQKNQNHYSKFEVAGESLVGTQFQ